MMDWKLPFGSKLLASEAERKLIYSDFKIHFDKVIESKTFAYHHKALEALNLSAEEEKEIQEDIVPIYREMQKFSTLDFPI